jgi:hypothetical protein
VSQFAKPGSVHTLKTNMQACPMTSSMAQVQQPTHLHPDTAGHNPRRAHPCNLAAAEDHNGCLNQPCGPVHTHAHAEVSISYVREQHTRGAQSAGMPAQEVQNKHGSKALKTSQASLPYTAIVGGMPAPAYFGCRNPPILCAAECVAAADCNQRYLSEALQTVPGIAATASLWARQLPLPMLAATAGLLWLTQGPADHTVCRCDWQDLGKTAAPAVSTEVAQLADVPVGCQPCCCGVSGSCPGWLLRRRCLLLILAAAGLLRFVALLAPDRCRMLPTRTISHSPLLLVLFSAAPGSTAIGPVLLCDTYASLSMCRTAPVTVIAAVAECVHVLTPAACSMSSCCLEVIMMLIHVSTCMQQHPRHNSRHNL